MPKQRVLVIGGGIAGLTVTHALARQGITVDLLEKSAFLGGHAIQLACKASPDCVQCGACRVERMLADVVALPGVTLHPRSQVTAVRPGSVYEVTFCTEPHAIDASKCTACGACRMACPQPGALRPALSAHDLSPVALDRHRCRAFSGTPCDICTNACATGAIRLDAASTASSLSVDAIVVATGFEPFEPHDKPYGYGRFPNVVTNWDLERTLRTGLFAGIAASAPLGPTFAFVQCVGSRDAKLNHLYCSQYCCAASLRTAGLLLERLPEAQATLFFIDLQSFGTAFDPFLEKTSPRLKLVRAIPGDVLPSTNGRVSLSFFDPVAGQGVVEGFDHVVLAAGQCPPQGQEALAAVLGVSLAGNGFWPNDAPDSAPERGNGLFFAGAGCGPMNIADSMAHARQAAWRVLERLKSLETNPLHPFLPKGPCDADGN